MADSNSTNRGGPAGNAASTEEKAIVLALDGYDHVHLFTLIELAERSLPNDTDADNSRACLRAAREFMLRHERLVGQEVSHG